MRHDQAKRGLHIVSTAEADDKIVFSPGFNSDEACGVGPVGSTIGTGLGKKVKAPTFHNCSKQLRRSKRSWWQTASKYNAYAAAVDLSCDAGQPKQTGHSSHTTAHTKQVEPSAKDSKSQKVIKHATGAVLGLQAPFQSTDASSESNRQGNAALKHSSLVGTAGVSIAAISSVQQLAAANSQTIAATAAQGHGVPVPVDGVHLAVGHAAESQLLQPIECSWQQSDQGEGAESTGASVQANQDTPNGDYEQHPGTVEGKTRWVMWH